MRRTVASGFHEVRREREGGRRGREREGERERGKKGGRWEGQGGGGKG